MTTLFSENNRRIEPDFGKLGLATNDYMAIRRQAEIARAKALTELLGKLFSGASKPFEKTTVANGEPLDNAPAEAINSFSQAQRESMAQAITVGEFIADAISAAERFIRNAIVAPVGRFLTRQRLMGELSGLSDRTLADIGIRRIDITTVAQDAFPVYMTESGSTVATNTVPVVDPRTTSLTERPANDDDAHRDVA